MKLDGKVALVTGASRGVGRATAQLLAREGCAVMINYWQSRASAEELEREITAAGGRSGITRADVADQAAVTDMVRQTVRLWGRLDILINNAGTTEFKPFDDLGELTDEHWDRLLAVNVKGTFYCARAAQAHLAAAPDGGCIVNVTSVAGMTGQGSSIAYCASKAALICLTKSLARAMGPRIRVNSVAPGFIDDDWTQGGLGDRFEAVKNAHAQKCALQRVSQPEDVAAAILSLVTGSRMVTGQNLVCDGGV